MPRRRARPLRQPDLTLYRWSSFGSPPHDLHVRRPQGENGPPAVYCHNDEGQGVVLVFDSWAEFRELAMTMRGELIGYYGTTKDGRIRKRPCRARS